MFGEINDLRSRPLPPLESVRASRKGYRDLPIDQTTPFFSERLVRASDFGVEGRNHYAHARNPPYYARAEGAIEALLVRETVGDLLGKINSQTQSVGLKLFLYDAWRPRSVQAYFHDVWMPAQLRARRPEMSDAEIASEVNLYWAKPSESVLRPAPHATGGAVDITLVWEDGQPLWMGSLFDDATSLANTDHFEQPLEMAFSNEEARANRRLLYWLMTEGGFCNHPEEWWHFSYGDQMWAAMSEHSAALYGAAEPDPALLA